MSHRVLGVAGLILSGGTALAQDTATDWEVIRQPERKTTFAYVQMSSGLTIGFRCVDGVFGGLVAGLPPAARDDRVRTLGLTVRDDDPYDSRWSVTRDRTVALADFPASLARSFRQGGPLSVVVPGGAADGRNLRYNLTLPPSSAAIDETLTACGKPLVDPRDELLPEVAEDGLPDGLTWAEPPRPRFPSTNYAEGYAVVSCVVQHDGRVDQCEVASEFPLDGRFGRNALAAMPNARVVSPGETPGQYAPRMIGFRVQYRMR